MERFRDLAICRERLCGLWLRASGLGLRDLASGFRVQGALRLQGLYTQIPDWAVDACEAADSVRLGVSAQLGS